MAYNPGGFEAREHPQIYTGHRASTLNLAYVVESLFGRPGDNGLPFYLFLTWLVALSIWRLLGGGSFAVLTACSVALSPGYLRTTLILDSLAIPTLLGFPLVLCLLKLLESDSPPAQASRLPLPGGEARLPGQAFRAKAGGEEKPIVHQSKVSPLLRWAGLLVILGLYATLNWTTAFAFAVVWSFLVVLMWTRPRIWIAFALIALAAVAVVGIISIVDKQRSATSGSASSLSHFYNGYLFGPGGYQNFPMDWPKAVLRIGSANLVGLLPLLALYGLSHYRDLKRRGRVAWSSSTPFATGILCVAAMRNYFAHHPWMSASVLIFGMVLSIRLAVSQKGTEALPVGIHGNEASEELSRPPPGHPFSRLSPVPGRAQAAFLVFCIAYGFVVVLFLRVNSADEDALLAMVRLHTERADVLVYAPDADPWLAQNAERLQDFFDRKMLPLDQATNSAGRRLLLTALPQVKAGVPVARIERDDFPGARTAESLIEFYRMHVAKRAAGDRLELNSAYSLYRLP